MSAYAMLEHRFGVWARLYASIFYLLTQIARMGVVMYLMALPMAVIFGWDIRLIIIVTGISVTVYSFVGGIIAVIWADAIQAIVLMAGAVICLAVLMMGVDGGPITVVNDAFEAGKFSLGEIGAGVSPDGLFWFDATGATFLVVLLYGLFINLQNFGIDQSYIQRYIASGSDAEARRSLWLAGWLYVPVSAVFFLIGTTLFVYYHSENHPEDLPQVKRLVAQQRLMQDGIYPEYEPGTSAEQTLTPAYAKQLDEVAATLDDTAIGDRVFPPLHCQAPSARPDGTARCGRLRCRHEHRVNQSQLVRDPDHERLLPPFPEAGSVGTPVHAGPLREHDRLGDSRNRHGFAPCSPDRKRPRHLVDSFGNLRRRYVRIVPSGNDQPSSKECRRSDRRTRRHRHDLVAHHSQGRRLPAQSTVRQRGSRTGSLVTTVDD